MVLSDVQVAPAPARAAQMMIGTPPSTRTFCRLPREKNPIHSASGEKNGSLASSVPAIATGSSRSTERRNSCDRPAAVATYATRVPSSDTAIDPRIGSMVASPGSEIEKRLVRRSVGCCPSTAKTMATHTVVMA